MGSNTVWYSVLIIGALIVVIAPFIIYAARKPEWKNDDSQFEPFHWEENSPAQPIGKTTPGQAGGRIVFSRLKAIGPSLLSQYRSRPAF